MAARGLNDLATGGGGGAEAPDCKSQIAACWNGVPMWNRVLFWSCLGVYMMTWLPGPF
jgi:hypothetical protein